MRRDRLLELRSGDHGIDQPPFGCAFALDAFLGGAEHIGMVAADPALVGDAGETAGPRQHRQERQLRQRNRRRAVVNQHDVVGRQSELIAAAGRSAVDGADRFYSGILAEILDAIARFIGELAEIYFMRMARAGQHADIRAGGKNPRFRRPQHQRAHLRMLEAQAVDRVGELDIDAKIVGVEFEIVALEQRRLLVDVHQ